MCHFGIHEELVRPRVDLGDRLLHSPDPDGYLVFRVFPGFVDCLQDLTSIDISFSPLAFPTGLSAVCRTLVFRIIDTACSPIFLDTLHPDLALGNIPSLLELPIMILEEDGHTMDIHI